MNASHLNIAELIPHHGTMCLLDTIESWDERHILCTASKPSVDSTIRLSDRYRAADCLRH